MDDSRIIAEVAKRHGVLLDRDDPILIIATVAELESLDHLEREQRLAAREERLAERDRQMAAALAQIQDGSKADHRENLAAIRAFTAAAEKVSTRPLITSDQIQYDVMPDLLANFKAGAVRRQALAIVASLVAGIALGYAGHWWMTPPSRMVAGLTGGPTKCEDQDDGSRLCWIPVWERVSQAQVSKQAAQQEAVAATTPAAPRPAITNGKR